MGTATFTVQVSGTYPLTYHWECAVAGHSEWQPVSARGKGIRRGDTNTLAIHDIGIAGHREWQPVSTRGNEVHGDMVSYKWESNRDGSSEWYLVSSRGSGDDTDTLVLNDIEKGNEGNYRCVIRNSAGEVTSDSVKLTLGMLHMTYLVLPLLLSLSCGFLQLTLLTSPLSHKTR